MMMVWHGVVPPTTPLSWFSCCLSERILLLTSLRLERAFPRALPSLLAMLLERETAALLVKGSNMTLDDVPAGVLQVMTPELARLFRAAGCQPMCHACAENIEVGDTFQLLSFDGRDQMLCALCDREDLEALELRREEQLQERRRSGGYSRQSI